MANIIEYITLPVGKQFVCYITYGDATGLSEEEIREADCWFRDWAHVIQKNHKVDAFYYKWGEDVEFIRDDVSGEYAECIDCTILIDSMGEY